MQTRPPLSFPLVPPTLNCVIPWVEGASDSDAGDSGWSPVTAWAPVATWGGGESTTAGGFPLLC